MSKASIRNKILIETLSEEMRILYVALTRAKEKLIITGIQKDSEKEIEKLIKEISRYKKQGDKINPILVKKYKKYLDWILLVYYYENDKLNDITNLNILNKQILLKELKDKEKDSVDVLKLLEEKNIKKENLKKIEEILTYSYPNKTSTSIPTKTSVTNIKQMKNETKKSDIIQLPKPEFLRNEEQEKLTGTQKGTLIHLCMQKLDEKQDYNLLKVKELIEDLNKKQIITDKEKENINPYKILEFTKSKIWNELKEAKEIYREKPFYINTPAKEIYDEEIEDNILVQGIIDLYYIDKNDNLILVDYKTDYVQNEDELIEKYKEQLNLYKKALELSYNKKVSKVYIYSTYLNKQICIN